MATGKSKRTHKVSKGEHGGGGKVRLTEIQKALLGKGIIQSFKPITGPRLQRSQD